jgi:hemerythrin-like domain-containing protein
VQLVDELRAEHDVIEKVLGSLRTFVARRAKGEGSARDGEAFVRFFLLFAGTWHHGREEDTLFTALTEQGDIAKGSGPVRSLWDQHQQMSVVLQEIVPLLKLGELSPDQAAALVDAVGRYSGMLLSHIDAENSVLLPESAERLRRAGITELPCRSRSAEEERARRDGEALADRYPFVEDRVAIRGEGCAICPSYGLTCEGLEREWWTDEEWETFEERQG